MYFTEPGDEVICDREAHIFNYESSSPARLSGIQLYPLDGELGILRSDQVEPYIRTTAYHMPRTKVIEVENTHNRAGGTIWSLDNIIALKNLAKKHQLYYHLDGARLWNACVETRVSPKDYAQHFDTISCCFSKGLGAPVGSAIAGSREFIHEAYRVRKAWGGGMRQVGILAAAALYAVQNNRERLKEDHWRAKHLAERIKENPNLEINMEAVQTNIILFKPLNMTPKEGLIKCRELGLILTPGTIDSLRAVTHLDINDDDIEKAANILDEVFK
ncbi:MAG: aminotransferase class I/II-fold pyridoxal phosphate-dependent enzyme [Ignavibacteriaceae bacterium]|nr:aminotransferase class I/II-fold pyridoxal phosphate-dependent enzyme [Ignavibacteriaceae bacterium]